MVSNVLIDGPINFTVCRIEQGTEGNITVNMDEHVKNDINLNHSQEEKRSLRKTEKKYRYYG